MKSKVVRVNDHGVSYDTLMFVCPGCVKGGPEGYDGVHRLPVNTTEKNPSWDWDGNLEEPTISPSILTQGYSRCHSFLEKGLFHFLEDSDHEYAGEYVPIPDLPQWVVDLE